MPDLLFGFRFLIPMVAGIIPFSKLRTTFMTPASPLAPSVCPILLFTVPINNGFSVVLPEAKTFPTAVHSIGSPTGVPVPWHSKYPV